MNVSNRWFHVHVEPEVRELEFPDGSGIRYRNDADIVLSPEDGVRHVCFLGDSFTFGHLVADVGDRFSNRVFRSLGNKISSRIDDAVYVLCLNDIEAFHAPTMSRSSSL